jgi:hypothetical protein
MSYTPNSVAVYIAAYTGALSGMAMSGRYLEMPHAAVIQEYAIAAGAFAQEFDTLYIAVDDESTAAVDLIREACLAVWENRSNASHSSNPTHYEGVCSAIIDYVQGLLAYFSSQGIPTDVPVTASPVPLSEVFYVDPGTQSTTHDGSIGAPYLTIQDAYDAHGPTDGTTNVTYHIVPNVSVGAGDLTITALGGEMTILGEGGQGAPVPMGSISFDSVGNSGVLTLQNMSAADVTSSGELSWDGGLYVVDGQVNNVNLDNAQVTFQDAAWTGAINCNGLVLKDTVPPAIVDVTCNILIIDGKTYFEMQNNGFAFSTIGSVQLESPTNLIMSDYAGTSQAALPVQTIAEGSLFLRKNDAVTGMVGVNNNNVPVWDGAKFIPAAVIKVIDELSIGITFTTGSTQEVGAGWNVDPNYTPLVLISRFLGETDSDVTYAPGGILRVGGDQAPDFSWFLKHVSGEDLNIFHLFVTWNGANLPDNMNFRVTILGLLTFTASP